MNFDDILILAKAGFTAEQISKISKLRSPEKPAEQEPPDKQEPPAKQEPAQPENDVAAQLAALTAALQSNAILQSKQPKTETAEDILASIINPD